jgi:hypothetical protein
MLRKHTQRTICLKLRMSGRRFRQIYDTGIITETVARRFNEIEGIELFKVNHPAATSELDQIRAWNNEHRFQPDCRYFRLFAEYFIEWVKSDRELGE